jgi:glutamine amidotransferase
MITIVNYGLGNVQAIGNIYRKAGIPVTLAEKPEDMVGAERLILPGVGAFDWAMHRLEESGMRPALQDLVLTKGVPVLGICVGMQMLADSSEEGVLPGLGWISGTVRHFEPGAAGEGVRMPHMGWNDIATGRSHPLFAGLESDARFYFLHSYYFEPVEHDTVLAWTDYGGRFASSVGRGNVLGVQFHPEKSHQWGVRLLLNFARG